jgi:hypothetical protein
VQDLGDVVVHPLDNGEQVLQIYGIGSREQLARLASLMRPPGPGRLAEARAAYDAYAEACASGDVDVAQRLTSRLSPEYSADRREFLAGATIRPGATASAAKTVALGYVPRISLAYILAISKAQSPLSFDFGGASRELGGAADWAVLAAHDSGAAKVTIASVLHREDGGWKVVQLPSLPGTGTDELFFATTGQRPGPSSAGFDKPVPAMSDADLAAARDVGEKYLGAWSRDDDAALLSLTSPLATFAAKDRAGLRKQILLRADEGICPATSQTRLAPEAGLTTWEAEWLAGFAGALSEIVGAGPRQSADAQVEGFPAKFVDHGDFAAFRYDAGGRDFLMLLLRKAGKWQVLEPAMPVERESAAKLSSN